MDRRFIELQREWYAKLKADGFKDLENLMPNGEMGDLLKGRNGLAALTKDDQSEFYRLASFFRHDYPFSNSFDESAWDLFCSGVTYRDIAKRLHVSLWSVHVVINELKSGPFSDYVQRIKGGEE